MANQDYIKSCSGILKALEFVTLLLAWVFFYEFTFEAEPKDYEKWTAFFFFAHLIGWLVIILLFGLFAFGLHESLGGGKCWCIIALVLHFVLAICCIVGAGHWAKWADDNNGLFSFKTLFEKQWNYLIVAVTSSLVSFVLLFADAIIYLKKGKNEYNLIR